MADTNGEATSTSYEAIEDIRFLECDQVSVELKEDEVGVTYTKAGDQGWIPGEGRERTLSSLNVSSGIDIDECVMDTSKAYLL